jgi:hypothetical protein
MSRKPRKTSQAPAPAAAAAEEAMHLHRPKPLHGWREISLEIGVIVVGIIIAIGLEQTVELVHHGQQRAQLADELRKDGEGNRGYIRDDIAKTQAILDWALAQASTLERAGPKGAVILRRMPLGWVGATDAGVWPSAKASGLTHLLPSSAQNWLEYLAAVNDEIFTTSASATGRLYAAYADLDQVIMGRAIKTRSGDLDLSALTAAQRATAVEHLRTIAERARGVLRELVIYDTGNDFILALPLDQLDSPQALKRYEQIRRQKLEAHPAAAYPFGGD